LDYTALAILCGAFSAFLAGMSKTGVPGVSILGILLMTYAFVGVEKQSAGALLPLLIVGDLFAVGYYHRHAQWDKIRKVFPPVALGLILGGFVLATLSHGQFALLLGGLILGLLLFEQVRHRMGWEDVPEKWWFILLIGTLGGFATMVGNAAGPVMAVYIVALGMPKEKFMGTWAWFFLIVNVSKVPVFAGLGMINTDTLWFDLMLIPALVAGALVGRKVFLLIPQKYFDPVILLLAALAAVNLVLASFFPS
jgi:hypothetical protein